MPDGQPKTKTTGGYIVRTEHGAFCGVCQSPLSDEEEAFGECDCCGGEGIDSDDDLGDWDYDEIP